MPRILRILNRFNVGGPVYNASYLTKYLPSNYETLLIGGEIDKSEASAEYIPKNLGIIPVIIPEMKRSINPINDYKAYLKIKRIISDFKPDIVHTHASKPGVLGRKAAYRMKVPIVVHTFHGHVFHSYFNTTKTNLLKSVERKLAEKTSAIIAISEIQKKELSIEHNICSPEKITVIPLGFDLDKFQENMGEKRKSFRQQYGLDNDTVSVGIIGRLVPIKNHNFFLKIIKKLKEKTKQKFKAFIIGGGELETDLKKKVNDMEINDLVIFTSWIKEVDIALAGLDIVALTSDNEGTPLSLVEAQAAKKPVITTKVGGVENILIEGKSGYIIERNNLEYYLNQLQKMVENKSLRDEFGQIGFDFVQKKYHYNRLINDVDALYKNLLEER